MVDERELASPVDRYLDYLTVERGRSPRTIASYRSDLLAYGSALDERGSGIAEAQPEDIDAHLDALRRAGRSPATIARARASIRGLHRFLLEEGDAAADPSIAASAVQVPSRLPKALDEEVLVGLIEGVAGDDPLSRRDRAVFELLYGTGARVSELTSLDLDALSFDDGLLRIVGKGDKERLVPIGRSAQSALGRWCAPEGRGRLAELASTRTEPRALFLNQRGGRLSRQGVHLLVASRARAAGIEGPVSPHALRHSCATHMLAHGADVRVVQELLGHASVATTQLYTKVDPTHLKAAYGASHPRARG